MPPRLKASRWSCKGFCTGLPQRRPVSGCCVSLSRYFESSFTNAKKVHSALQSLCVCVCVCVQAFLAILNYRALMQKKFPQPFSLCVSVCVCVCVSVCLCLCLCLCV